jgi:hypothetical protein
MLMNYQNINEEFVKVNKGNRFNVTLDNGRVLKNIAFFISGCRLCFMTSRQKRYGSLVHGSDLTFMKSLELVTKPTYDTKKNAESILKRIHPNAWSPVKDELEAFINGEKEENKLHEYCKGKVRYYGKSIKKLLGVSKYNKLVESFENQTPYKWSRRSYSRGNGRDLSISCEINNDGLYRAYFSSEFKGCLNGDYFLLLNPNKAIYYERD